MQMLKLSERLCELQICEISLTIHVDENAKVEKNNQLYKLNSLKAWSDSLLPVVRGYEQETAKREDSGGNDECHCLTYVYVKEV